MLSEVALAATEPAAAGRPRQALLAVRAEAGRLRPYAVRQHRRAASTGTGRPTQRDADRLLFVFSLYVLGVCFLNIVYGPRPPTSPDPGKRDSVSDLRHRQLRRRKKRAAGSSAGRRAARDAARPDTPALPGRPRRTGHASPGVAVACPRGTSLGRTAARRTPGVDREAVVVKKAVYLFASRGSRMSS